MRLSLGTAIEQQSPEFLAEMHAISAALKARCTGSISKIVDESRTILGGHGYSAFSRLNEFFHSADVMKTWEGDNHVLLIQTSKYLLKALENKSSTQFVDVRFVN